MGQWRDEEILITVKAYPNPSQRYREASCVAGITREQEWRRLYPIRYRMLETNQQFAKYTWVHVRVKKSQSDFRPESYTVDLDSICLGERISTQEHWAERKEWLLSLQDDSLCRLQRMQPLHNRSLGLVRPQELRLEIVSARNPEWTLAELHTLSQQGFFDREPRQRLEKIPYDFFYHFRCADPECAGHQMKIVDWEICQSYRSWRKRYGVVRWKEKLIEKYQDQMNERFDTRLFVGTMLRHPQSWIIVGLFYPPRTGIRQRAFRL